MNITSVEYQEIMSICNDSDVFFFTDHIMGDNLFRIFNYRFASYNDWTQSPLTFELRGLMIEIDQNGEFIKVASRPPCKFFNKNENPFTMDLQLNQPGLVCYKEDGSLISTFVYHIDGHPRLGLKSKGSLISDQALAATKHMSSKEPELFIEAFELALNGITSYYEYCSPTNRIVLPYQVDELKVLGCRDNLTGIEMHKDEVSDVLSSHWTEEFPVSNVEEFLIGVENKRDIEGYVIWCGDSRFKVKTLWYLTQHNAKDSVNNDRRLFETVIADAQDDLRSMFYDDPWVQERIDWMEGIVQHEYNSMVTTVETFYNKNKHLDRKSYAIKGRAEVKKLWFGLVMNLYLGKTFDWKEFMMSRWKEYGIKDQQKGEE